MDIPPDYLKKLKAKKPVKARNLLEEIAWKYLPKFDWFNDTLERDFKFFWSASRIFWKSHTPSDYERVLSWGAERGVHVKGIANLLKKS